MHQFLVISYLLLLTFHFYIVIRGFTKEQTDRSNAKLLIWFSVLLVLELVSVQFRPSMCLNDIYFSEGS